MSEFYVGFASGDITPKMCNIGLWGYGASHLRLGSNVLHPLQGLCTAIKKDDLTMVFLTIDMLYINPDVLAEWRKAISERTGLPEGQLIISCTHTHSAPAFDGTGNIDKYQEQLLETFPEICAHALADMKPAKIAYNKGKAGSDQIHMNFVRHYTMTDIEFKDHPEDGPVYYCGDNSGIEYSSNLKKYCYTGHMWDADNDIQVIRFVRKDADDVVWVNFQAHPVLTGSMTALNISSDYPYTMRQYLEKMEPGVKAVFMQGCCGNINPHTRLRDESIAGVTNYADKYAERPFQLVEAYGSILAIYARRVLLEATEDDGDAFTFKKFALKLNYDHHEENRLEDAKKIREIFVKEGRTPRVSQMCLEQGFNSPYHCSAIVLKSTYPKDGEVEINALRIGNIGMVTMPFEVFDRTGVHIKEQSPFKQTMIQGYSCGTYSYIPCKETCDNCYEWNANRFEPGSAEIMQEKLIEMLNEIK